MTTTNFKKICYCIGYSNVKLQWNFDIMKGQGTGKVCLLLQGFIVSWFFSIWFTITRAMKIVC